VFSFEVIPAYSIPRPKSTLALVKGCCEIGFFSFSLLFVLLLLLVLLLVLLLEMASVRAAKTLASRRLINNSEVFREKGRFQQLRVGIVASSFLCQNGSHSSCTVFDRNLPCRFGRLFSVRDNGWQIRSAQSVSNAGFSRMGNKN
jgi:hypothetical protein